MEWQVYLVHFPVQTNISAKQTLEDNIRDVKTRKEGERKALGTNREELAVEAAEGPSRPWAGHSWPQQLVPFHFIQVCSDIAGGRRILTHHYHSARCGASRM